MATKKDLVEAHAFNRRRLVTAFVSGAPGGREVEPPRPGRTVAAGVALAVLLVAGAAVVGVVRSPSTVRWTEEGLVTERETGADYLVLRTAATTDDEDDTELRSLANLTSAMLLLGADVSPTEVGREEVDDRPRGAAIGILGAPETPPQASRLVPTGWTACTGATAAADGASGIRVRVADPPAVTPTPDLAVLVRTVSGDLFLVGPSSVGGADDDEQTYVYAVPDPGRTDPDVDPVTVPDTWVTLFPDGGALERARFGTDDAVEPTGQPCAVLDTAGEQPGVRLATTDDGSDASAAGVPPAEVARSVEPGRGAFVQAGGWSAGDATSPVLVDDQGYAYPVGTGPETANLGYAEVDRVVVPDPWVGLFRPGPPLTIEAAGCPPSPERDGCS